MKNSTFLTKFNCLLAVFMFCFVSSWAQQCLPPTNLTLQSFNQISATITWNSSADASSEGYQVEVRTAGTPGSGQVGLFSTFAETANSTSISGLFAQTHYQIYVRSICTSGVNNNWSAPVEFNTTNIVAPVATAATNITDVSFVARWNEVLGATWYEVDYSTTDAFETVNTTTVQAGNNLLKLIGAPEPSHLDADTDYWFRVRAFSGADVSSPYSVAIPVHTDTAASTEARWTSEGWLAEPTADKVLKIEADFNTATDEYGHELLGKSLILDAGKKFTIMSGDFLILTENVINNSSAENFVIESNGRLLQNGNMANINPVTIKRESFPIYRLDYTMWSSPVQSQNLLDFSPLTVPSRFYSYNSASNVFQVINNVGTKTFTPGQGYLIRSPNNWVIDTLGVAGQRFTGKFVGVMNTHDLFLPVNQGYNMIGNPFPTDIFAAKLIVANDPMVDETIYFWRRRNDTSGSGPSTSFYATWTDFAGVGIYFNPGTIVDDTKPNDFGIIKVGQGFIVKMKSSGDLLFNKSIKTVEDSENIFLKNSSVSSITTSEVERHKIYLGLTGASGINGTMVIGYASNATDGVDGRDGEYFNDSPIALTSLIENNSYVIQAKALPFQSTSEFALRFQTSVAASYTISLGEVTGMFTENVDPILVDMLTNTTTNLRNASYTFASEIGIFDTRFKIVFVETALGNVDVVADANAVIVMSRDNVLTINAGAYTINNVEIFDMLGRKIYSKSNVDANTASIADLKSQQQIILVQIATDHGVVTKKVQF